MKKFLVLALALLGVAVLSGCNQSGSTANNANSYPAANAANTAAPAENAATASMVNIQNFTFKPATLTVNKGTAVTWTNNDSANHQLKSATFNSSPLSQGQSFSFTFTATGTFDYSCAIHPSMNGQIIVK